MRGVVRRVARLMMGLVRRAVDTARGMRVVQVV
jgi:hypothetical protein